MAKFKVTKVYIVEAKSKAEAVDKASQNPDSLEMVFVKELPNTGVLDTVKKQLLGE